MKNRSSIWLHLTAVFGAGCALAGQAMAQTTVPNTARPNTIERQNRIDVERPTVGGAPVISAPQPAAKTTGQGVKFELKGIKIEGGSVYGEKELSHLYADKVGTKITLDDLNAIAADITSYYRNNGYILTRAVVPPQRAEGGEVTIRIVEGFVDQVKLQGDVGGASDDLLKAYAEKIRASKPLDASLLERYLLLMEDLPGVEARAVLQPSESSVGATDVVVTITRRAYDFSVGLDNRGSRYLGPVQLSGDLILNNLLDMNEYTQVRVTNSIFNRSELLFGELRHLQQLGTEGTTLVLSANYVDTQPGSKIKNLEIEGSSNAFSAGISHPIIRSRRANWFVNTDITARNADVNTLGTNLYEDKTRVLSVGTAYDFVDGMSAINKAELNLAKGFNWGTGSDGANRSRANGETDFSKLTAKASRIQPLWDAFSLYGAVSGQYSNNTLLASEEFAIGGAEFGSAYDAAEITGDSGIATRAELQYSQSNPGGVLSQYQLYTFYDIGKVWNDNPIAGSENPHDSLSSAGVGARFNLMDSVSGGVEGAYPLTRNVAALNRAGDHPRVFFNLQYRY